MKLIKELIGGDNRLQIYDGGSYVLIRICYKDKIRYEHKYVSLFWALRDTSLIYVLRLVRMDGWIEKNYNDIETLISARRKTDPSDDEIYVLGSSLDGAASDIAAKW